MTGSLDTIPDHPVCNRVYLANSQEFLNIGVSDRESRRRR